MYERFAMCYTCANKRDLPYCDMCIAGNRYEKEEWPSTPEEIKKSFEEFTESINRIRKSDETPIVNIQYLCDRKKCGDNCDYPLCSHTHDISHATSFRKTSYDTITGKTVTTYTEKAIDDVERKYFSDFTADWQKCTDINDPMPNEGDDVLYTLLVDYSYGKGTEIVKFVCDGEYKKEKDDIYDAPASNGKGYFEMDADYDAGPSIEVIAWMPKPEAFEI